MGLVRGGFRPEYLNRLDEIIIFHPLTRDHIRDIVRMQTTLLADRVRENAGIVLVVTDAMLDHITAEGYDPTYGARPIKRFLQRQVENRLATALLAGELVSQVTVDFDGRNIVFP